MNLNWIYIPNEIVKLYVDLYFVKISLLTRIAESEYKMCNQRMAKLNTKLRQNTGVSGPPNIQDSKTPRIRQRSITLCASLNDNQRQAGRVRQWNGSATTDMQNVGLTPKTRTDGRAFAQSLIIIDCVHSCGRNGNIIWPPIDQPHYSPPDRMRMAMAWELSLNVFVECSIVY